jgi:hypothetical protein
VDQCLLSGGKANNFCSRREFPLLTDAVEKVGGKSRMHNNLIKEACNSTQRCANYWFLESTLRRGTLKILFNSIDPKRT